MTYEEAIKEAEIQINVYENMILYNKDFEPKNDNSNYEHKIEFLKIAIEALEKQIPKKVEFVDGGEALLCPCCGIDFMGCLTDPDHDPYYCYECGQAIDWSDIDEYERYK